MSPEPAKLDPQARAVLERAGASKLPQLHTVDAVEARRIYRETRKALFPAPPQVAEVRELSIPRPEGGAGSAIAARSYLAAGAPSDAVLPGIVYFHGGGWIYGDLDTHDIVCRGLANHCGCRVFSVDYRLAPEHRFPAGVEDAIAATQWVAGNAASLGVDPARLVVAGDSAGGNLAAVVALALRDQALRDGLRSVLAMQVLIYPATDQALATESHSRFAQGFMLTREAMLWVRAHYLRDERDIADWRASPLRARDLSGLPPAYILTAGFDPLQDEGRAYAERLIQAGVAVTYECFEGQMHGFIVMGGAIAAAHHAIYRVGQTLRLNLARLPAV